LHRVAPLLRSIAAVLALLSAGAFAQEYPVKPIRLIVPWPQRTMADTFARALAPAMGRSLAQPVLVENRPGASGTLGALFVARSAPDGYTLAMTELTEHAIAANLFFDLPYGMKREQYDAAADFAAIGVAARSPLVLVTNPSVHVRTMQEFVGLARERSGRIGCASSGLGTVSHLAVVRLERSLGVKLVHIPFRNPGTALSSVLANDTEFAFVALPDLLRERKARRLTVLGSSFTQRPARIPKAQAIAEAVPGFDMGFYAGMLAPAGTPQAAIDRLHAALEKAMLTPEAREALAATASEPVRMTRTQAQEYLADQAKMWADLIRAAGVTLDD
jgi:tripartite-type tricarboxylate transporter receptor subunit TctC